MRPESEHGVNPAAQPETLIPYWCMRLLLTILLAASVSGLGQNDPAIQAAEKQWASAIKAKDAGALQKLLGEDLIYAHSTGIVDTKAAYIEKITSGRQKYEGADQESATVRIYGSTAVVHARMHMWGVNQNGKFDDYLMMMHVWIKSGNAWRLVAHQTTKLK